MSEELITVEELLNYCEDTEPESNVWIYINDIPIGFGAVKVDQDFDTSIKIHIEDKGLKYVDE